MDLLATVRKEGSRGGRGDFKWSDVQSSSHRENYLGHSLMAPVGRWQKGRDLNWYAKADSDSNKEDPTVRAARERKEEIRRVKEAEEDALGRALGLPVAPRNNPNMEELGAERELENVLKEAAVDGNDVASRGVGYGRTAGVHDRGQVATERLAGTVPGKDKELEYALKEYKRRHGDRKERSRSRSRDRHRDSHSRRDRDDRYRRTEHHRRSPRRERAGRRRSRSRTRSPDNDRSFMSHRRNRSHSSSYHHYENRRQHRERTNERPQPR